MLTFGCWGPRVRVGNQAGAAVRVVVALLSAPHRGSDSGLRVDVIRPV